MCRFCLTLESTSGRVDLLSRPYHQLAPSDDSAASTLSPGQLLHSPWLSICNDSLGWETLVYVHLPRHPQRPPGLWRLLLVRGEASVGEVSVTIRVAKAGRFATQSKNKTLKKKPKKGAFGSFHQKTLHRQLHRRILEPGLRQIPSPRARASRIKDGARSPK